jgi:UDP-N-acetylmuramoylalanine--D-glutamate ligase
VAVWLNLSDDHLDRHASMEVYAQAKARIVANQTSTDWAVLNAEDPVVMQYGLRTEATPVTFSVSGAIAAGFVVEGAWIVRRTGTDVERLVALDAVELTGRHMLNNVLAATAVAHIVGASPDQMTAALAGFHGLEHVMEPVAAIGDVRFVNDSKATNVDAACRSIESFEGVVAIVGGHFKGGDLHSLGEVLREHGRAAVVIGDSVEALVEALSSSVTVSRAHSMREAVERAYEAARPGGVVLLAPACASFDWFRDYAERGQRFKEEVARLKSRVEEGTQV